MALHTAEISGRTITSTTACSVSYRLRAILVCCIVLGLSFIARNFRLDDALIYARYIANALHGQGLVFNAGEPVNALTSILSTWLTLALAWLLHGHILLAEGILSAVFLAASALLAEYVVPFAGMFFASLGLSYYCIGMETSLFVFLLAVTMWAYVNGRWNWLPLLCLLTALARFEGAALALVIGYHLWRQRRYPSLLSFLPAGLLIAFYFAFNLHSYHILLPHSATAKFGQGMSGNWGHWPTAFLRVPDTVFTPLGKSDIVALALFVLAGFAAKDSRISRWNPVAIPFLLILGLFYVLFNIPAYHWYFAPFVFFIVLYVSCLIPQTRSAQMAALFLALCTAVYSSQKLKHDSHEAADYRNIALWIDQNTPQNARIATVETGTIGWYCDRYIIDILGLTTPANASYLARRDYSSWLSERPDYIVVHRETPFPWEKVAMADPHYELLPVRFGQVSLLRRKP
jgi:arabinofuranosyltransferase